MVRNNRSVKGPRSALTSFLEEKGIRNSNPAQNVNRWQRNGNVVVEEAGEEESTGQQAQGNTLEGEQQEQVAAQINEVVMDTVPIQLTNIPEQPQEYEMEEPTSSTAHLARSGRSTRKKISTNKGEEEPKKKNVEHKGKRKKGKGYLGKGDGSSDESSGEEFQPNDLFDDPGPSNHRARFTRNSRKDPAVDVNSIPQPTGVTFCTTCNTRFVLKASSLPDVDGNYKCGNCDFNLKAKTREAKRSKVLERDAFLKSNVSWFDKDKIPTLQMMCINVICANPEMVEGLSNLSYQSTTQIVRILSKHRMLNSGTLPLFLAPASNSLSLFDCAKLDEAALGSIATAGTELTELKLLFCGQMTDSVIEVYGEHLHNLNELTIHGAFLVTDSAFVNLITKVGANLSQLSINHSPRLHLKTMQAIVQCCVNLTHLNLADCEKLDNECINLLIDKKMEDLPSPILSKLKWLDLSSYSSAITPLHLGSILKVIGPNLTTLKLNNWTQLSDDILVPTIPYLSQLTHLELNHCEQLTGASLIPLLEAVGYAKQFQKGLNHLNLGFTSIQVDNEVVLTLLKLHSKSLTYLNLSGLDSLTELGLRDGFLTYAAPKLRHLDLSWVRATSDPLLTDLVPQLPSLNELRVWGCHQVTENLPNFVTDLNNDLDDSFLVGKNLVKVVGRECDTL